MPPILTGDLLGNRGVELLKLAAESMKTMSESRSDFVELVFSRSRSKISDPDEPEAKPPRSCFEEGEYSRGSISHSSLVTADSGCSLFALITDDAVLWFDTLGSS